MPLIIKITRGYAGGHLSLRLVNGDLANDVQAGPTSKIHWLPVPTSKVIIDEIGEKDQWPQIFDGKPAKMAGSNIFEGILIATDEFIESAYYIKWHFDGSGSETYDPIMSINPSLPPSVFRKYFIPVLSPVFAIFATVLAGIVLWKMKGLEENMDRKLLELKTGIEFLKTRDIPK